MYVLLYFDVFIYAIRTRIPDMCMYMYMICACNESILSNRLDSISLLLFAPNQEYLNILLHTILANGINLRSSV